MKAQLRSFLGTQIEETQTNYQFFGLFFIQIWYFVNFNNNFKCYVILNVITVVTMVFYMCIYIKS